MYKLTWGIKSRKSTNKQTNKQWSINFETKGQIKFSINLHIYKVTPIQNQLQNEGQGKRELMMNMIEYLPLTKNVLNMENLIKEA